MYKFSAVALILLPTYVFADQGSSVAKHVDAQVQFRALSLPGSTPLFLVGQDTSSLEWLSRHAQTLQQLGANGLAVEVDDARALRRIQTAAPGLKIWPVSGDDIAERLELEHYPVLITPTGLEQ
ncbi:MULTISPECIES: integrating conjugative element protein [Pseudomonas]|uniref:integrating conjugative element protein n=1 Tax=Pseudomonas TaxID=286 RepID=UPI001E5420F2|nr:MULTISPECIES: integrating conjugative element protein [Pseudomonas]WQQ35129.1 integrating conjugative element protein [Pseudomonas putida]